MRNRAKSAVRLDFTKAWTVGNIFFGNVVKNIKCLNIALTYSCGNFLVLTFLIFLLVYISSLFSHEHLSDGGVRLELRDTSILEAYMKGKIHTGPNSVKNKGSFSRDPEEAHTGSSPTLLPHCLEPPLVF